MILMFDLIIDKFIIILYLTILIIDNAISINFSFVHKIFADYIKIYIMADDNRNSEIEDPKRTKSLMGSFKGSFKMAESLLVPGRNKKVVNLDLPGVKLI